MKTVDLKGARLSPQQSRLWHWLHEKPWYRVQCALEITGDIEEDIFQQALQHVVDHNEILRTTFTYVPGMEMPMQAIREYVEISCPVINIEQSIVKGSQAALEEHWHELLWRPFDLEHGPLFYAELLRLAPRSHVLMLSLHTLCADSSTLKQF